MPFVLTRFQRVTGQRKPEAYIVIEAFCSLPERPFRTAVMMMIY